jgi:mRNA degradation ribonuclease J1/J2
VPINKKHKLAGEPLLISRGFLRMDQSGELMDAARKELKLQLHKNGRNHDDTVRETLQNFFYHKTQSRPVILPNIVRV